MESFIEGLMIIVNTHIINKTPVVWEEINNNIISSSLDDNIKNKLLAIPKNTPRQFNNDLFNLKETLLEEELFQQKEN